MARDKSKPSKSEAIREVYAQNPNATMKEVRALLAEKGTKVNPSLVYMVKSQLRKQKHRQVRRKVAQTMGANGANPVALIIKVKGLAAEVGGIQNLKRLVEVLAE